MPHVIRSFEEVTPDWLDEAFGSDPGSVSSCRTIREWDTLITRVALVHLDYTAVAPGKPISVFIKIAKQNQDHELKKLCAREVLFYTQIAGLLPARCIPRCHLAVHDQGSDDFCIVLEDLSASHFQTEYPVPPSIGCCRRAVRCLAQIHAAGWNHGELGPMLGRYHTKEAVEYWSGLSRQVWGEFSRFLGDRLSDERRRVVEQVMENIDRVLGRTLRTEQQTILHRDTHSWNFFFPREEQGEVKLFDWQLCEYGLAADDLVPMIALNWYPERRSRFEKSLLKEYHVTLNEAAVGGYGLEELETEYRWSVLKELVTPIMQWHHNVAAGVWFNNLEKILLAVEDLNCMELLERKAAI
jgi:aminoglycoside/choline kinase family phosphotransferase